MFYKIFQALELFPLKQVNSKQTTPDQSVSKGFMTEEREKTGIPKQRGRGSLASCPKQIQGLSSLNAFKDGDSITSVGFRVWPPLQWTFFPSYRVGISHVSRLCWLPLSYCRAPWVLSWFGTNLSHPLLLERFQESLKTWDYTVGLEHKPSWSHVLSESPRGCSYDLSASLWSIESVVI